MTDAPKCEKCGSEMVRSVLISGVPVNLSYDVCPLPAPACQSIAELKSKCEALTKRNEELEELARKKQTDIVRLYGDREKLDCRYAGRYYELSGSHCALNNPCQRCELDRERDALSASESRAQEAETKLHAALKARDEAADQVVMLTEALRSSEGIAWDFASLFQILASSGYKKVHGEDAFILAGFGAKPECDCWLCETLSSYKSTLNAALKFDIDSLIERANPNFSSCRPCFKHRKEGVNP